METNKDLTGLHSPDVVRRLVEADIRAELEAHLDLATEEEVREGHAPQEARARALDRFGNLDLYGEAQATSCALRSSVPGAVAVDHS